MSEGDAGRAFVLGLDGVPWDRLSRWVKAGELPNFAALFEEGVTGPLDSTRPANTALAWPSISAGVRPDKHGIYAFHALEDDYRHRLNTSADRSGPALWDRLSPATVANVPMTYPASAIEGRMVAGMLSPRTDERFTHPPELAAEIEREVPDYAVGLDWNEYGDRPAEFAAELSALLDDRRELMQLLLDDEDWRLFFFVYTAPDRLQHLRWEDEVLIEHYRELDAVLGEVREYVAERDATLFVVSDHGFGPVSKHVHPNTVLARAGYLAPKDESGSRSVLSRLGLTKSRVMDGLERVGVDDATLVTHLPEALVDGVAARVPGENARYDVAYPETRAFVHGPGNLYLNDAARFEQGVVAPDMVDALKGELAALLEDVRDPETDEPVLEVHDGDDLFPTDPRSPDLVIEPRAGYYAKPTLSEAVFTDPGAHAADHRPEGIFLAWGPDVAAGARIEGSVLDVAPTVLHAAGEAIPSGMDGRVLTEAFAPGSPTATRPIETTDDGHDGETGRPGDAEESGDGRSGEDGGDERDDGTERDDGEEDFSGVEERLQGLGYLE
jgi:predicted AlkP superfamily phosphohydrolase/phosphomutase